MKADKDVCVVCRKPVDDSDMEAVVQVLMPKGLTTEVVTEAFERSVVAEQSSPSIGPERWAYLVLASARLHGAPDYEDMGEDDRVIHGHALCDLGARIVEFHAGCAEAAPRDTEYMTAGWLNGV